MNSFADVPAMIAACGASRGKVYLVGAGPGDPELLTVKAIRAIRQATVLLVDDLVGEGVLRYARRSARIASDGPRIRAVLTIGTIGLTAAEIDAMPALELVCALGVGYENIDVEHARAGAQEREQVLRRVCVLRPGRHISVSACGRVDGGGDAPCAARRWSRRARCTCRCSLVSGARRPGA